MFVGMIDFFKRLINGFCYTFSYNVPNLSVIANRIGFTVYFFPVGVCYNFCLLLL